MVHNLTGNTYSGKKWWLLKHGRLLQMMGILLFIILPAIMVFLILQNFFLFYDEILLISMVLLIVGFFVIFWMISAGDIYSKLYCTIKELGSEWVIEDFDPRRYKVSIRDEARQYVIFYYSQESQLPDHYQVWTQYGGGSV
jgi:hypothetical protein